ncbi:MAG: hypothetical protein O3A53_16345 [Acidobacteria bacterium]|nr:hypothetical protein [Acidobacteriota bacterium]MDA1236355.1 hypothetical protein [Acidobacteriota bacterium]
MSIGMLNRQVRDRSDVLRDQFATAQPFCHLVADDLLDRTLFQSLVQQFPAFETKNALNEFGEVGGISVRADLPELGSG